VKEIFEAYASYNVWANQRLLEVIGSLSAEQQTAIVPGSFPSLVATLKHMWQAEFIWYQRVKLVENVQALPEEELPFLVVADGLLKQSKNWEEWVYKAHEKMLQHVFHYQNSKREQFKQPVHEMLLHLFNHATYHRGQLISILHQLGISKLPATDFIEYARRKK